MPRSTAKDGTRNRLELLLTTKAEPVWKAIEAVAPVRAAVNKTLTNLAIQKFPPRPNLLSTKADFTSWASLTDRTYTSRHLPPVAAAARRCRTTRHLVTSSRASTSSSRPKSTVHVRLLRAVVHRRLPAQRPRHVERDPRRNDVQPRHRPAAALRRAPRRGPSSCARTRAGGSRASTIGGAEFPPYLYEDGDKKPEFCEIQVVRPETRSRPSRLDTLFAAGQRHDELAGRLRACSTCCSCASTTGSPARSPREYPGWDDERLFQTARNIMIVLLIKIVIEEYINHITPYLFQLQRRPGAVHATSAGIARTGWRSSSTCSTAGTA